MHKLTRSTVFLLVLVIVFLSWSSLWFFSSNFLLKRNRLLNVSSAKWQDFQQRKSDANSHERKAKRVILFLIDALRYDFVERIHSMGRALERHPDHTLLFKFRADAPTTTSQRLRSLLTGSLPVFIEQGDNFNSDLIQEQIAIRPQDTVVLGDGTWADLLGQDDWLRMRTWPSFNVWDLDGVDNGILRYLHKEIHWSNLELNNSLHHELSVPNLREAYYTATQRNNETNTRVMGSLNSFHDWKLLVAHFLGVDHAGHRYGVSHPEMQRKLDQMSHHLQRVMDEMPQDTILMVFGDHGMNDHGDHGGATHIETDSALFVYSKPPQDTTNNSPPSAFHSPSSINRKKRSLISQLDFTPTLAWLLNYPIPFSNLGLLISEITSLSSSTSHPNHPASLDAAYTNLVQVFEYLDEYTRQDPQFIPPTTLRKLYERYHVANATYFAYPEHSSYESALQEMESLLLDVAQMCRERWAQFNVPNMLVGLVFLILSLALVIRFVQKGVGASHFLLFVALCILVFYHCLHNTTLFEVQDYSTSLTLIFFCCAFTCALGASFLSNRPASERSEASPLSSGRTSAFFYLDVFSLLCFLFLCGGVLSNSFLVYEDRIVFFLFISLFSLFVFMRDSVTWKQSKWLLGILLVGICVRYSSVTIRYRQHGTHHISKLPFESVFSFEKSFFWMLISCTIFSLYRYLDRNHWKTGPSRGIFIAFCRCVFELLVLLLSAATVLFWKLDSIVSDSPWRLWIPRLVFFVSCTICFSLVILWRVSFLSFSCRHWRLSWNEMFSLIYQSVAISVILIKGHAYASTFAFMTLQVCLLVYVQNTANRNIAHLGRMTCLILWILMGKQYFFSFGQQNTLDTIQWTAAFVGVREFDSGIIQMISGTLVVASIFSTRILHALTLPWLFKREAEDFGEVLSVLLQFEGLCMVGVIFSSICVHVHRRHLMVWAIFAPKFMFDAIGYIVSGFVMLFMIGVLFVRGHTIKNVKKLE